MVQLLKKHGKAYLMEAVGLAGFVFFAGLLTILFEHPDLPVMHGVFKNEPLMRRVFLGLIMGLYVAAITQMFGKKSGAQINPAVTWSYFRLGKINLEDAILYTIAQFAGAIIAAQILKHFSGGLFGHAPIDFGVTKPKPPYETIAAFCAEFIISYIMMILILRASSSKRFEKYTAVISGVLLGLYLIFEIPFSGMSMNPARSFAGAFAANEWQHLWIYFVAPLSAMLIATEIFMKGRAKRSIENNMDYMEIKDYPVEK